MRNCRTIVAYNFEDNFAQKKAKLTELCLKNKRDSIEFNVHSTLKMDSVSADNPDGEVSLANGLLKCAELFRKSALFVKKVG